MAELVDALVSGTSISNGVQVRVLFWAPVTQKFFSVDYAKINFVIIFAAILMPRWWNELPPPMVKRIRRLDSRETLTIE